MTTDRNKEIMAANIKKYMERKGVTNQQFCDDLDFKYTTFLDWINCVTYPRMPKIEAMANYFGIKKSDLIEENKKPTDDSELSGAKRELIDFANSLSEDEAGSMLRMMKTFYEEWQRNQ